MARPGLEASTLEALHELEAARAADDELGATLAEHELNRRLDALSARFRSRNPKKGKRSRSSSAGAKA